MDDGRHRTAHYTPRVQPLCCRLHIEGTRKIGQPAGGRLSDGGKIPLEDPQPGLAIHLHHRPLSVSLGQDMVRHRHLVLHVPGDEDVCGPVGASHRTESAAAGDGLLFIAVLVTLQDAGLVQVPDHLPSGPIGESEDAYL